VAACGSIAVAVLRAVHTALVAIVEWRSRTDRIVAGVNRRAAGQQRNGVGRRLLASGPRLISAELF